MAFWREDADERDADVERVAVEVLEDEQHAAAAQISRDGEFAGLSRKLVAMIEPAPWLWLPAYTNMNESRDCVAVGQLESEFRLIFLLGLTQISWRFSVCMSTANGR